MIKGVFELLHYHKQSIHLKKKYKNTLRPNLQLMLLKEYSNLLFKDNSNKLIKSSVGIIMVLHLKVIIYEAYQIIFYSVLTLN